jgi:hypothetical protein
MSLDAVVIVIRVADLAIAGDEMNKFRPQDLSKSYIIKQRLKYGRSDNYNFQSRVKWYPVGWGFNKRVIGGIFGRLHYLACHAPTPVQKRYQRAYRALEARLIPRKASIRYINTYTAAAWL